MTMTTDSFNNAIVVDLPDESHEWARLFASKQSNVAIGKQVYLNTLAVYAVHYYLAQQGIESDLEQSQSWYPHALSAPNAADLIVPGVGCIECRPVLLETESAIIIPDTAWSDRESYVAIGIGEQLNQVQLLGYLPVRPPEDLQQPIPVSQLLPIHEFPEHLQFLQDGNRWLNSDDDVAVQVRELEALHSLSHLVAQLEVAYNETEEIFQDRRIASYLSGATSETGATSREAVLKSPATFGLRADDDITEEDIEDVIDTLAEDVLDKLKELWGDRRRRLT
jgi:hypothetical protein